MYPIRTLFVFCAPGLAKKKEKEKKKKSGEMIIITIPIIIIKDSLTVDYIDT